MKREKYLGKCKMCGDFIEISKNQMMTENRLFGGIVCSSKCINDYHILTYGLNTEDYERSTHDGLTIDEYYQRQTFDGLTIDEYINNLL